MGRESLLSASRRMVGSGLKRTVAGRGDHFVLVDGRKNGKRKTKNDSKWRYKEVAVCQCLRFLPRPFICRVFASMIEHQAVSSITTYGNLTAPGSDTCASVRSDFFVLHMIRLRDNWPMPLHSLCPTERHIFIQVTQAGQQATCLPTFMALLSKIWKCPIPNLEGDISFRRILPTTTLWCLVVVGS
jgi:hypothetical protein